MNTQQTRTRFWDGKDNMFRDDVSRLKGNHLFQFGGIYQHNSTCISAPTMAAASTTSRFISWVRPPVLGRASPCLQRLDCQWRQHQHWGRDYAAALGIVSASQIAYTRSGPNLTLNPPLTPAFDKSTIPFYNVYFSDTWHMKPTFTFTYGLGWTLEMPPVEKHGKQVEFVNAGGPAD